MGRATPLSPHFQLCLCPPRTYPASYTPSRSVEAYQLRQHGSSSLQVEAVPLGEHAASVALRCSPTKRSLPWDDRTPFNFDSSAHQQAAGHQQAGHQQAASPLQKHLSLSPDPRRRVTDVTISDDDARSPHTLGRVAPRLGASMDRSWRRPYISASGVMGHVGGDPLPLRWPGADNVDGGVSPLVPTQGSTSSLPPSDWRIPSRVQESKTGARVDISHGDVSLALDLGMSSSSGGTGRGSSRILGEPMGLGEPPPPRHALGLSSGSYARRHSDVFAEQRPELLTEDSRHRAIVSLGGHAAAANEPAAALFEPSAAAHGGYGPRAVSHGVGWASACKSLSWAEMHRRGMLPRSRSDSALGVAAGGAGR